MDIDEVSSGHYEEWLAAKCIDLVDNFDMVIR